MNFKSEIKNAILIILGVFVAAYGIKGFLIPKNLTDGGIIGISLIFHSIFKLPLWIFIIALNLPFAYMATSIIGKNFAIKSIVAVIIFTLVISFIPFPIITKDIWLVTVFGGFFLGAGVGLVMRGGALIDGTEILSIYLSKKLKLTISDIQLFLNILIFIGVAVFISLETSLYSIITYFTTIKVSQYVVEGIDEYIGVTIVTKNHGALTKHIVEELGRGVTLIDGEMGFGKKGQTIKETKIIYTVITRMELTALQNIVEEMDSDAFLTAVSVKDIQGGMIKKRPLKKK